MFLPYFATQSDFLSSTGTVRKEMGDEDVMYTRRVNSLNQWQLVISLASILGLISFALLITIIIVIIYICCRVCKRDNKLERYYYHYNNINFNTPVPIIQYSNAGLLRFKFMK